MKNVFVFFGLLLLAASVSCKLRSNNDINITVSDSDNEYKFSASFDKNKTGKVHAYIENSLDQTGLFGTENDAEDYVSTLDDNTTFHLKASPGELKIIFDKEKNSAAAYKKMKQIGQGISELLKEK